MPPVPDPAAPPDVTLVVPAFNEAGRLAAGYARLAPVLAEWDAVVEVIVVDDGSSDRTGVVAAEVFAEVTPHLVVRHDHNRGKGAAVRTGIAVARGARLIVADADMAIDPHHFPAMAAALDRADLVPGSRALDGHVRYRHPTRTVAGRVFNRVVRHYSGVALGDTQCGAKAYRLGAARAIALLARIDGFAFDAEFLYLARELGLSIEPFPVTWTDVAGSSVNLGSGTRAMIVDLRTIGRSRVENPVVALVPRTDVVAVREAARTHRVVGAVLARGASEDLLVLSRDDAVAGAGLAATLGGRLRVAGLDELRGREFVAV